MNGKRDQPGNERKTRNAPNAANQANSFFFEPSGCKSDAADPFAMVRHGNEWKRATDG